MGCNNAKEDNNPPKVDIGPDTEKPFEDPKDTTDLNNRDENDAVSDTEEPIENPKDSKDPDMI
jgi:hypothetical protein